MVQSICELYETNMYTDTHGHSNSYEKFACVCVCKSSHAIMCLEQCSPARNHQSKWNRTVLLYGDIKWKINGQTFLLAKFIWKQRRRSLLIHFGILKILLHSTSHSGSELCFIFLPSDAFTHNVLLSLYVISQNCSLSNVSFHNHSYSSFKWDFYIKHK